jgi:NADH-quinone oxidoreductase subunit N
MTPVSIAMEITAPKLEYGLLMPFILVFVGACVGVLAEAVVPRRLRFPAQLFVSFVAIAAALIMTLRNWVGGEIAITAVGSVAVDGPTYFLWALLLVFGALSLLVFAERKVGAGASVFAAQAAAVPGTAAEREAVAAQVEHTEVCSRWPCSRSPG